MRRRTRSAALWAALIGLVLSIAAGRAAPAAANNRWGANYFPDVTLTTHDGRDVKFYDLIKGRIVAINLIYTNCQYACPIETSRLARMQQLLGDRMGREVFFISISIDPEHDTPAVLKAYADKFKAGPGWIFVTGKMADIDAVSRKLGLWSDPAQTQDGHTPMLLLGNETSGQWTRTSALDNPAYTTRILTDWMTGYKNAQGGKSYTEAPTNLKKGDGEYMYRSMCAGCHTIGAGDKIGPDLGAAIDAHGKAWMADYTLRPEVLRAKKDPVATALANKYREVRMPNLSLSAGDVDAILRYVETARSHGAAPAQPAGAQATQPHASAARPNALVDAALALHSSLARDTMVGVRGQAVVLRDAAAAANAPQIASAAADVSRQPSLEGARRSFGVLSEALVAYAKTHTEVRAAGVRVAYCPMARKSWLQKDGPVQNPYYGTRMLACGELTH